jgi:hypothetical protein
MPRLFGGPELQKIQIAPAGKENPGSVSPRPGQRTNRMQDIATISANSKCATDIPLEIFFDRACTIADRVKSGGIPFLDAVDMLWTAAEFAGTVERCGPDAVQSCLAKAFTVGSAEAA